MTAALERAHHTYEQRQGLIGMTKLSVLICDSITINIQQPFSPSASKKTYSTKNHHHGLVSTGIYMCLLLDYIVIRLLVLLLKGMVELMVIFTFINISFFAELSVHINFFIRFFFDLKITFKCINK